MAYTSAFSSLHIHQVGPHGLISPLSFSPRSRSHLLLAFAIIHITASCHTVASGSPTALPLFQAIISRLQPWHTQDFDLYGTGAIEFIHALDFCEGNKVATLKPMPGLIQAGDDTRAILVGREVSRRVPQGTRRRQRELLLPTCPPECPGLSSLPS